MSRSVLSRTPFAALCAAALVAACSKGDSSGDSIRVADSAAAANIAATQPAAPAAPALTDPNIVALLDAANVADSAAGVIAASKGTSADVKSFGRDMARDHHALRKMGQDLATKLNVTPAMPAGDSSAAQASAFRDSLNAMPKGAAWDQAYIGHEVAYHEAVLRTAQAGLAAAQNAELKALIEKAAPNVQAHLERARSLPPPPGGTASAGPAGTGKDTAMAGMKH